MASPNCPITTKYLNCQKCWVYDKFGTCPYIEEDKHTDKQLKFYRQIVEEEIRNEKSSGKD